MQKRHIISALLVLIIILLGAVLWAFQRGVITFKDSKLGFSKSAITNPMPSLDRQTNFPTDFSDDAKTLYNSNIAKVKEVINSDPTDFNAWLDLAVYYRMVGDNEGAVEVWEYLRASFPQDAVSRHNLGEHYFHTVKDYPKAEMYYRESIDTSSALQSNYTDLYEMYRYAYKQDTNAAIDILIEGKEIGGAIAIQFDIMIGRHYRDVLGDKENARKYLTMARDAAAERGDRSVANDLTAEINAL